jgi:class 3 adenylate cyclase
MSGFFSLLWQNVYVRFFSDGFLVISGLPTTGQLMSPTMNSLFCPTPPPAPSHSIRSALKIATLALQTVQAMSAQNVKRGWEFMVRIGVASGPILLGLISDDSILSFDVMGEAVNEAHRLMHMTKPGIIATNSAFREDLERKFVFEHV